MRDQYAIPDVAGHPGARRPIPANRIAAYVFMVLLAGPPAGAAAAATPDDAEAVLLAACDADATATVLHPQAGAAVAARAYWLDRRLIQWPGVAMDGRFRLYRSATAALIAEVGQPVRGADGVVELPAAKIEMTAALAERFRFIGGGPRFLLPEDETVDGWLRDQVLLVREDAQGRVLEATALQSAGALDDRYAEAEGVVLGAIPQREVPDGGALDTTTYALWAPTAQRVHLCLYGKEQDRSTQVRSGRTFVPTGVWTSMTIGRNDHGREYAYLVDVYAPGVGIVRNRVTDPYAFALSTDSTRSVVLDPEAADTRPEGWDTTPRPPAIEHNVDLSVYELHVRDFSRDDATVRAPWRGKYLAFTEPDSAGMRHLRALRAAGMTDVHLLPVYDLSTVPERGCVEPLIPNAAPDGTEQQAAAQAVAARDCFNWGYDPYHYGTPEGSYAVEPDGAARVREFRAMVRALHASGLRVGMDVVYNHTFASGQDPKSVLDRIVPGYYHRLDANGRVERSTCCENTATEHRMMAKLMIDTAVHWVRHYRIDSFRFDLMGHQPRAAMERLQAAVDAAAGRRIALIGEGWNFGEIANGARFVQASQLSLQGSGIATFSDRARDALRGGGCCDGGEGLVANQGLLNGLQVAPNAANRLPDGSARDRSAELLRAADLARIGLAGTLRDVELQGADGTTRPLSAFDYAGQPAGYAAQPGEVVNYVENHDNMTLFDLNALRLPRDTSRRDRARVQLLGIAFTALGQGVAYYHAGVEILRSKSLDKNSFDSGDAFNRLDWSYTDNGFGRGLPPEKDNGRDWPWMRPVLADAGIAPQPEDIRWMRDAALDLMRIRASSTLFRMRSADDVRRRLSFRNTGPGQNPQVIVVHLEGEGYPGAGFREVLYFINVSPQAQTLLLPEEADKPYVLHPVQRAEAAVDRVPQSARHAPRIGRFVIPPRTVVVYVIEP
jgi:pullulanase/glycogen debranching enzyme